MAIDPHDTDALTEEMAARRHRRLPARERRVEAAGATALVAIVAGLPLAFGAQRPIDPVALLSLLAALAVLFRVRLDVGGGSAVATQLAFVPALFVLPPALAPALVVAALVGAQGVLVLRGRAHAERLLLAVNDGWYALGPAVVLVAAGAPSTAEAPAAVLAGALLAQFGSDVVVSAVRELLGRGIPPSLQLRVMAPVIGVDCALSAVGFMAAHATGRWAALPAVPLAAVFAALARDRRRHIDELVARGEQLSAERERLRDVIQHTGRAFAAGTDRDRFVDAVLAAAVGGLGADVGRLVLHDEGTGAMHGEGSAAVLAAAEREATWRGGVACVEREGVHAAAIVLGEGGADAPAGTIAVGRAATPFSAADREVLAALAAQVAVAVHNVALQALVARQAVTDELTGVANVRRFRQALEDEVARWRRQGVPAGIVLLDIDDFKAVNDTHGHQVGDRVLAAIGRALMAGSREVDVPARYGGEEFGVVLPGTGAAGAMVAAEKLRGDVAALRVPLDAGGTLRVTASVGVAAVPEHAADAAGVVAAADAALYAAKRAGKDRAFLAPRPAAAQHPRPG